MPALPDHDFEDRLCQVFHETGESFVPDTPRLAMGGATRGRRRQRRRLALGAAAAVLAVSGLGAAVLPSALQTNSTGPAASPVPSPPVSDPPDAARIPQEAHLASAVAERLPKGLKIVRSDGSTQGSAAFPTNRAWAELVLDDGQGQSLLSVGVFNPHRQAIGPCTELPFMDVECRETHRQDGSTVAVMQYTGQGANPNRFTAVQWVTADGMTVNATSHNTARRGSAPDRAEPLLSADVLSSLATDPGWRTIGSELLGAMPKSASSDAPVQRPDLLPPGLKVLSSTSGAEQTATLADGDRTVVLRLQEEAADRSVLDWFADAPTLPDDTRIRSVANRPVLGTQGSTESVVDVLRPDGRRVRVTAVNPAGAGDPDAGREPLLTLDQLTAIARCPGWTVPAPD
ncbi:hypothetical protein ACFVUN_13110 [Kitasatospora griseola]|uniref:hypothetical protein n=1 Tax=Kitasatospora griseola TaxID=2064 RepID=UPI0036DDDB49